ncbi:EAL and HDOD domain-containing protein [Sporomusa sp.]|uniref:EAL and HDOD domain-containing protein n=1 Tax=Sporomusa sp. TaxID=2078658 RepID=UPI002BCAA65A|nr:HDOD domain-containing protein [Sporomusa sp.]HWR05629.1 HDOD domain-containing protein [Sporomusa sp.]
MVQETEVHVARQPIFDNKLNVFGYELLFRSNFINSYDSADGDQATHDVIANSFLLFGLETLTGGKKAFINFTANSLRNNIPAMLPRKLVAVEILEDIIPDAAIINACKKLKQDGYLLVLDDFAFAPAYLPLVEVADIIKVDFRTTPPAERWQLIQRLQGYPLKFLAEKVETHEEFEAALQMGYSYFQGYFFCKPLIMSGRNLPGYKANYLHILQEINRPELEFSQIEAIIRRDVSLSYKLLKFINSSVFGFRKRISSLRQALTLLGQKELIKWVSLIALKGIGDDKPGELILRSLIRARFAESLAAGRMPAALVANAFLMGMFSHIDVLLDRPIGEILEEISLDERIRNAILEKGHNQFSALYKLIQTYEQGDWQAYSGYVADLGINEQDVAKSYRESLLWAHDQVVANY